MQPDLEWAVLAVHFSVEDSGVVSPPLRIPTAASNSVHNLTSTDVLDIDVVRLVS
jgi:hypothetical protein